MVKTVRTSNLCNLSAEEFWGLRMDVGFDLFMANARSGGCEVLELKEQGESVTRTTLLTYQENPIPPSLRGMLGANEFSCKVKARWSRHKFEAGHGMAFTSEPPVFADRIKVGGTQWLEPVSATQCRVLQQTDVSVKIFGVGGQVEAALSQQITDSCAIMPRLAEEYVGHRRKRAAAIAAGHGSAEATGATGAAADAAADAAASAAPTRPATAELDREEGEAAAVEAGGGGGGGGGGAEQHSGAPYVGVYIFMMNPASDPGRIR